MAVGFRAAGAVATGVTDPTAAVGLPAGATAGDLHVLVINLKSSTVTITTPTGWTALTNGEVTGGAGTVGTDAGPNRVAVFTKVMATGDAAPTVDLSAAPNSYQAYILGFTKAANETWADVVCASASDTSGSATSYGTVTGNATIDLTTGDWAGQVTGFNGDAGTPGTRTFAVPGVTLGTYVARVDDVATTQGGDLRTDVGTAPYSSGTASGAPTLARTWTTGNASFAGATVFFRVRAEVEGTPATISGIHAWYRANKLSQANGTTVQTWPDSSGNYRNATQATAGLRPTFVTPAVNSLPTLRFDADLGTVMASPASSSLAAFTIFIVINPEVVDGTQGAVMSASAAGGAEILLVSQKLTVNRRDQALLGSSTTNVTAAAWQIWAITYNGASNPMGFYRNNTADGTPTPDGVAFTASLTYLLGNNWYGDIAELIIYSVVLNSTDRTTVYNYLSSKYALGDVTTGLPPVVPRRRPIGALLDL
jgi:hypothetical protein